MTINKLDQIIDLARKLFDAEHADTSNADWIWQTYPGLMERYKDLARVALQVPSAQEAEILNIRLRGLQAQVEDLQRNNLRHRADKNEMATEIAELKAANLSPVLTLKYRVEELENEIKILRTEKQSHQEGVNLLAARNNRLKNDLGDLRNAYDELRAENQAQEKAMSELIDENITLENRDRTPADWDRLMAENTRLTTENADLEKGSRLLIEANNRLRERVAKREQSGGQLDKELGDVIRRIYKDMRDTQS